MKVFCDIQIFDQHQIIRRCEDESVIAISTLSTLGTDLAELCNENDIIDLSGFEDVVQGIIAQGLEKNNKLRFEVIANV